jgi:surfactin family lipopeptide synthetase C
MLAYQGKELPASLPYKAFVADILSTNPSENEEYWATLLKDASATQFPLVSEREKYGNEKIAKTEIIQINQSKLDAILKKYQITTSTFFRVAWTLTLKYFCRKDDLIFGIVTSGRESDLENIEK